MIIPISRFIELRDEKADPETYDEFLETARFVFRCECARIEQAHGQRRPVSPQKVREMEMEAVKKIMQVYKRWQNGKHTEASCDQDESGSN